MSPLHDSESSEKTAGRPTPLGRLFTFAAPTGLSSLRSTLTLVALGLACAAGWSAPTVAAATQAAKPTHRLATLLTTHQVYASPAGSSTLLEKVAAARPLTGERTALPILGEATADGGVRWLDVALPGRPNGHSGWIRASGTHTSTTAWQVVIDLSSRRVSVYYDGVRVRVIEAIVGKPSTPTPLGRFFVEESIRLAPSDVGAPYALALSARSHVFQRFDGGPGQIALHGLENVGGQLGTAASHGCVRVSDSSISWLAARIGPGVPVTITN